MKGYTSEEICKILIHNGWQFERNKGSHKTFVKQDKNNIITIPNHKKELYRPMVKRLLKEAEIKEMI